MQNNSLVATETTIHSVHIPSNFDDYKIVQLSDLHSKSFGDNQKALVQKVTQTNPDAIVFTGDLVDSKRYEEEASLMLMHELIQIAPVYFVTGNHEWWSGKFSTLEKKLSDLGVNVLRNASEEISIGNEKIYFVGIDDPAQASEHDEEKVIVEEAIVDSIQDLPEDTFKILLAHRPEMFALYSDYEFNIVLAGHAHGGQFRIPLIGGLVAPNQGFFPKYTAGKHTLENTSMIANRGLGNSIIPIRLFNRPEIVVVTLKTLPH